MLKVTINGRVYLTNVSDPSKITKCIEFYSSGCLSFAVSFGNDESSIIQKTTSKNMEVSYLKRMNFEQVFIPIEARDVKTSEKMLKKGYDLIELL